VPYPVHGVTNSPEFWSRDSTLIADICQPDVIVNIEPLLGINAKSGSSVVGTIEVFAETIEVFGGTIHKKSF
jgi:hypothetical protein